MLRRSIALLQAPGAIRPKDRNPYAILGVAPTATDAQIKDKFKQLARKHHPDMPHGSAAKFREINAAYQIVKTERKASKDKKTTGSAQDPKQAKYNYARSSGEEASQAEKDHFTAEGAAIRYNEKMFFWTTDALEYVLTIVSVAGLVLYSLHRSLVRFEEANSDRYGKLAELERLQASPVVESREVEEKDWRVDMAQNKVRVRHDSLTEFLIENDVHHAFDRKISSTQLAPDLIDQNFIDEKCPVVLHMNTQGGLSIYEKSLPKNTREVMNASWKYVDTGPAVALALQSVATVPYVTPSTHHLTFFEYKSSEDKYPRCAAAVINHKYSQEADQSKAPVQKISITGDDTFQPALAKKRMEDLRSGAVKEEDLLLGGAVPVKGQQRVIVRGSSRDHLKHSFH